MAPRYTYFGAGAQLNKLQRFFDDSWMTSQCLISAECLPLLQIGGDVLAEVLRRCGVPTSAPTKAVVDGCLSSVLGQWPPAALMLQRSVAGGGAAGLGGQVALPQTFDELFETLACSPMPAVAQAGRDKLHQVG